MERNTKHKNLSQTLRCFKSLSLRSLCPDRSETQLGSPASLHGGGGPGRAENRRATEALHRPEFASGGTQKRSSGSEIGWGPLELQRSVVSCCVPDLRALRGPPVVCAAASWLSETSVVSAYRCRGRATALTLDRVFDLAAGRLVLLPCSQKKIQKRQIR